MKRCFVLLAMSGLWGAALAGAADGVVDAASESLAAARPTQAYYLMREHPDSADPGEARLLLIEASLALGRVDEAQRLVGDDTAADWPPAWRSRWSLVAARVALGRGRAEVAKAHLIAALRDPTLGHRGYRAVALLVESARMTGDADLHRACLNRLWQSWHAAGLRIRAGLELARLRLDEDPERSRAICTGIRVDPRADTVQVLAATELLCRILLESSPAECVHTARDVQARFPERDLTVIDALAVAARARLAATRADGAHDRSSPVVSDSDETEVAPDIYLARQVHRPEADFAAWRERPAAATPLGALAVASVLVREGDRPQAEAMLHTALDAAVSLDAIVPPDLTPPSLRARLYHILASLVGDRRSRLRDQALAALRTMPGPGTEVGMAWARHAETTGDPAAWARAHRMLPVDHPWSAIAAYRGARPRLRDVPPGTVLDGADAGVRADLEAAVELVSAQAWRGDDDQALRCRYLLAQALAQLGRRPEALVCIDSLEPHADPSRRRSLAAFRRRLGVERSIASEAGD